MAAGDEVTVALLELRKMNEGREGDAWPEGLAAQMSETAERLVRALRSAGGKEQEPTFEEHLHSRLRQLTDGFGSVASRMRSELGQVQEEHSRAATAAEINDKMLAKLGELHDAMAVAKRDEMKAEAPLPPLPDFSSAYDLRLASDDLGHSELDQLRLRNRELTQEVEELSGELECTLADLHQARTEKEQFEREVSETHTQLVDRLSRLKEEQACLREAITDDATSGVRAELQRRVTELEAEVDETRKRLEHVTRQSEQHLDRALRQQISNMEVTLSQVQRRKDATEGEARGAYRQARRLRMDTMYSDCFQGSGMTMIWSAIQSVFECEFAGGRVSGTAEEAVERFRSEYDSTIAPIFVSSVALREKLSGGASLKELYQRECAKLRVKPNSGVLRLLPVLPVPAPSVGLGGKPLGQLDLSDNFLGDKGLQALLPLLQKLPELEELGLAHNGLQNRGVHALVEELRSHPSIRALDLSHNRISRSAGKELVTLIAANPRVQRITLDGTRIDEALKARIQRRLTANAAPPAP
eukprot:Hpha_TRINITY_DN9256_c0_g1::TRINITY_DN9256_c0_g1_i1::g.28746::m.28746